MENTRDFAAINRYLIKGAVKDKDGHTFQVPDFFIEAENSEHAASIALHIINPTGEHTDAFVRPRLVA